MARTSKRKRDNRQRNAEPSRGREPGRGSKLFWIYGAVFSLALLGLTIYALTQFVSEPLERIRPSRRTAAALDTQPSIDEVAESRETRFFQRDKLTLVWDKINPSIRAKLQPTSDASNITPDDYVGSDACVECHKENHADWSTHSHRWMNALATEESVLGDFSGEASIDYRGGVGRFFRQGDEFRMRFERDDVQREYLISQTIGSRFYQYYVGRGVLGPEPKEHDYYHVDFVLPFGYWLDRKAWVPIVHTAEEKAEGERWESVEQLKPTSYSEEELEGVGTSRGVVDHSQDLGLVYAVSCNYCHTTFPLGEMLVRNPKLIGPALTDDMLLEMSTYVAATHPEIWSGSEAPELLPSDKLKSLTEEFISFDAREKASALGISCEACHLGCNQHVLNEHSKPAFTPQNPHLLVYSDYAFSETGRTSANLNAACARCHAGNRPTYAGGMSTWNSTEYSDAKRGSCYSELSCVHCHDPHQSIGKAWPKTPDQDDASCLTCHEKLVDPEVRQLHTRHPAGTPGDRCLNCHMPKINEGMQDVVRTHTIFSPTQPDMIEANHPNACNLCHLDKSIDWTVSYLQSWYGRFFDGNRISQSYADTSQPVGLGWLNQSHEPTRLVALEAFAEQRAIWGLPTMIDQLDDPHLLNRQFAQTSIESLTEVRLDQQFGYWYYMTPKERRPLIDKIRAELVNSR